MGLRREKRTGCPTRLALALLLVGSACLGLFVAINFFPRLLVTLLGLERLGALTQAPIQESAPLILSGDMLDHVYLELPPYVPEAVELTPARVSSTYLSEVSLMGDTSSPGRSRYLLTIEEDHLNALVREHVVPESLTRGRYRDMEIDLQPGGLILYASVDFGIRRQRVGLVMAAREESPTLSPVGVVLDGEVYAMPTPGSLRRLLFPDGREARRLLYAVRLVGPLPGKASVETVRFYDERLQILAEATYAAHTVPDTGWLRLAQGVELREVDVPGGGEGSVERLSVVRLASSELRLGIRYDPGDPKTISQWAEQLGCLLVVNGSYFASESEAGLETIGLLISDGQRWGTPLGDFAGMLAVTPSGEVSVRSLQERSYNPQERLAHAIQSFPVLVKPGGIMGFPVDGDDGAQARRTVVAQDSEGRILFLVAPHGTLSLHEMAVFLAESDMTVEVALNLDGGRSTGMWLAAPSTRVEIDSFTPVPSVIAVGRR